MFASVVTGQYCSVHQLLFVSSLQEWLSFSPAHIEHAFGDAMQVVEATCPRCLAMTQTAIKGNLLRCMHRPVYPEQLGHDPPYASVGVRRA